uniref:Uncharacterized protein n=1 Tax=Chromera velia CCMP2878 TaxID=1169474 RepID=A0A0G4I8Y9_9ALVE|mmetsp:Transcript_21226/g.42180  ORF Transcript_21226/g.42180 Transcript_21226/m.42180 type:complete len:319 (+) Transcript_21226:303-1259(+)|eukprot:Cvel_12097.t1-p1 / transcript=Cvel_12097.t1 / gene=Cvel_12097 / organism=Chromera_velia_CCMP2878 / gene_product=hypothetical protein / transcript_product=hypothetical protein / location=Cvel_scaffold779:18814-22638(+) / protein_length=318 / sequence_SO=supercontig / SO=protein_coding / is_pseudo=false
MLTRSVHVRRRLQAELHRERTEAIRSCWQPHGTGIPGTVSLLGVRNFQARAERLYGGEREDPVRPAPPPPKKRWFDLKTFRGHLRRQKQEERRLEEEQLAKEYALDPPEGWGVKEFLDSIEIGENSEEIAEQFESWKHFAGATSDEIDQLEMVTNDQRRKMKRFLRLFNHGLWPPVREDEYLERFKGKKMEREGLPWTEEETERLRALCEFYDVSFGDPFLYISWEMQRRIPEVRQKYVETILKPQTQMGECELAVTKASRPLLMNRKFKLDPPFLYVVPSKENFRLARSDFRLPDGFVKYRQPQLFCLQQTTESEVT